MVLLVDRTNIGRHRDLMEEVHRFRHRIFVEKFGWEALRKPDGREVDQFDTPDAGHLVGVEDGRVVAYTRFLPTTGPHLLSDVYPEILGGADYPRGPQVVEWTRLAIAPEKRAEGAGRDAVTARLFIAAAEACLRRGITGVLGQGHPFMLTRMLELGWSPMPLALPTLYAGEPMLALSLTVTAQTLTTSRKVYGISEPVLEVDTAFEVTFPAEERRHVA